MVEGHFAVCLDEAAQDGAVQDGVVQDEVVQDGVVQDEVVQDGVVQNPGWLKLVRTGLVKLFEHLALDLGGVDFV